MMNKGLELIEAHHLFGLSPAQYDAVIHPQSIMHCLVEFCDGSMVAQIAQPDMRMPITQSLFWPERRPMPQYRVDFTRPLELQFEPIDLEKFPAFGFARAAMQTRRWRTGRLEWCQRGGCCGFSRRRDRIPRYRHNGG